MFFVAPGAVLDRRALKRYAGLFAAELADREDIVKLLCLTVSLADRSEHDRKVVLEVFKPELAAVVGAGRYLAGIRTTAEPDRAPSRRPGTYPSWQGACSSW